MDNVKEMDMESFQLGTGVQTEIMECIKVPEGTLMDLG